MNKNLALTPFQMRFGEQDPLEFNTYDHRPVSLAASLDPTSHEIISYELRVECCSQPGVNDPKHQNLIPVDHPVLKKLATLPPLPTSTDALEEKKEKRPKKPAIPSIGSAS